MHDALNDYVSQVCCRGLHPTRSSVALLPLAAREERWAGKSANPLSAQTLADAVPSSLN